MFTDSHSLRILPRGGFFSGEHAEDESEGTAKCPCDS